MALRQPSGVIPNGCRTALPSATWRTDPRTRHFPAPHRRPCQMASTPGRDQDVVMETPLDQGEPIRNPWFAYLT
jgi:hypothetical protein